MNHPLPIQYQDPAILRQLATIPERPFRGVFRISNEAYHSGPGVSKSMLDTLDRSPMHYWAAHLDPERPAKESAPHFDTGSAVHTLVLEPDLFDEEFAIAPALNRRTKEGKKAWAEFMEENAGKILLTREQYDEARRMADSILAVPLARQLLQGGTREKSFYWTDEETGLLCRVRPDYLRPDILVDLKTTKDASNQGFTKTIANYRYYVQAPYYCHGVKEATGGRVAPEYMLFLAVEKTPPYPCNFFVLDERSWREGERAFRDGLNTLKRCMDENHWPGYGETIKKASLPTWHDRQRQSPDCYQWRESGQEPEPAPDNDPFTTFDLTM